ncbi:hypothetical protein [Arcobacter sp. YIC-80]|uniref:hypothetical protein n=1 Tax=unclassified Arcobacter TaxID=2593671 RepID=UPI00384E55B7
MSILFLDKYIDGYKIEDPIIETIYEIVFNIKRKNYDNAYKLMQEHQLSFENIVSRTQKLKLQDLTEFADYVIKYLK